MKCNCESLLCHHHGGGSISKWKPCQNDADPRFRVIYLGHVCEACYKAMPAEYQLPIEEVTS